MDFSSILIGGENAASKGYQFVNNHAFLRHLTPESVKCREKSAVKALSQNRFTGSF